MADRVKEAVTLLKKLKSLGINEKEPAYNEIKDRFDTWIKTGEAWSGKIEFLYLDRDGDLELPYEADKTCSLNLKVRPD